MNKKQLVLLALVAVLLGAFFVFDLGVYLKLETLRESRAELQAEYAAAPWRSVLVYCIVYVTVTALSLPGAAVMTLGGAAIFGFATTAIAVSFASTIGATLAFLLSRFMLKDWAQRRFAAQLVAVNRGVEKDGALYLFMLRLVPAFPFFVINLVMGLSLMRASTFFWVSQLGMLPGTLVFVNAGSQLGRIDSAAAMLSPSLIGAFVLLGMFPWLVRAISRRVADRRKLRPWPRPKVFETNLVVIGAGSGGLVAALIAAAVEAKVVLVERNKMGGDCLNTGCVPSKALIRSARLVADLAASSRLGIHVHDFDVDFAAVMRRVGEVVKTIEPHDSVQRFTSLGVECVHGEARILSPYRVRVGNREIVTRTIVIATGARPAIPPIPGLDQAPLLTSDNIWQRETRPGKLLVLGGGPIGVELAQALSRLGSEVSLVEMAPRLLPREDPEVSQLVAKALASSGVTLFLGHRAQAFSQHDGKRFLTVDVDGRQDQVQFEEVLVAIGRRAVTDGLGLEELGISTRPDGTVETNEYLQTDIPTVFACGDVAGPYQFTHTASHQAWYATINALFGGFRRFRADYSVIPMAVFCDPEVARVGINETQAVEQGVAFEITRYPLDELDRAIADDATEGFVKILTASGSDRILGATIVGSHAAEMLAELTMAMRYKLGLNKILSTVHVYPSFSEAAKFAAGSWKRAHAPATALRFARWLHRVRRG